MTARKLPEVLYTVDVFFDSEDKGQVTFHRVNTYRSNGDDNVLLLLRKDGTVFTINMKKVLYWKAERMRK